LLVIIRRRRSGRGRTGHDADAPQRALGLLTIASEWPSAVATRERQRERSAAAAPLAERQVWEVTFGVHRGEIRRAAERVHARQSRDVARHPEKRIRGPERQVRVTVN